MSAYRVFRMIVSLYSQGNLECRSCKFGLRLKSVHSLASWRWGCRLDKIRQVRCRRCWCCQFFGLLLVLNFFIAVSCGRNTANVRRCTQPKAGHRSKDGSHIWPAPCTADVAYPEGLHRDFKTEYLQRWCKFTPYIIMYLSAVYMPLNPVGSTKLICPTSCFRPTNCNVVYGIRLTARVTHVDDHAITARLAHEKVACLTCLTCLIREALLVRRALEMTE